MTTRWWFLQVLILAWCLGLITIVRRLYDHKTYISITKENNMYLDRSIDKSFLESAVNKCPFILPMKQRKDYVKSFDTQLGMALVKLLSNKRVINLEVAPPSNGVLNQFFTNQKANVVWKSVDICLYDPSVILNNTSRFDWGISLELDNYNNIPRKYQNMLIDNLVAYSNEGVLISGYQNKQLEKSMALSTNISSYSYSNISIIEQMNSRGFYYDFSLTKLLRNSMSKSNYLKESILVFKCCNQYISDTAKIKNCTIKPPPTLHSVMGGWEYTNYLIRTQHVKFDEGLGTALIKFLDNKEIVDIGAGVGQLEYLFIKQKANVKWTAFDGGTNIQDFHGKNIALRDDPDHIVPRVCWLNAAVALNKNWKYDWVVSIEVGEHIPKKFESVFIDNLVSLSLEGIILSWAVPGQNGYEHVNTQSNEYIIDQMQKRGVHFDKEQTSAFRDSATIWYLKNTIMVFRKK